MDATFSFIHISDQHFCVEPRRRNVQSLSIRRPRLSLDTLVNQPGAMGFLSLARPASYSPPVVSSAAQFCYVRQNVTDGIVITGDLATTGSQIDINVAKDYLLSPASSGFVNLENRPTLRASNLPTWIIPGNHDKYSDAVASPKSRNFELTFGAMIPNYVDRVGHKVRRKNGQHIAIIFADFSLQERAHATNRLSGPYGQGKVYDTVLHGLEDRTRYLRSKYKGIHFLWAIHFAPFSCATHLQLIDWSLISKSALMLNIPIVLCGHTHVYSMLKQQRCTTYCAGAAGAIDSEDNSYVHVINITCGANFEAHRLNYKWDRDGDEFLFSHKD